MLIEKLLGVAVIGVEPVLWVLIAMSVISFGVIVERVLAFGYIKNDLQNLSGAKIRILLEKRLGILATFGNNAPFIGLFGTVLGIINAFHTLSKGDEFGINAVMGGISEALVATAAGLFVAIPSVIAYNYFIRKIKMLLLETEANER
ncbi:MAG: MotA/TolQ/ExbB proton channel family protein [Sulfurimonas sp.]|jgi:biopolymer transport protein ExbB|uniref:MotA/TolQ/ExbB proton channel family protein n=1 Tax=unclassified Sulfurimonas TaxID=2623549 RepID=UPI0008B69DAF|nr:MULTISPECIES: MotA/TolQ/ExbB proton channel family protein [unclassified Sulfurimonas]OHE15363.1 MAG: flagellar motor protein MotA [Sulfurimonas sp. RIFOXYB2_FULL_37_5]OHE15625.1 MAG: flagellar motor protein MotA [Sulfurimonas sp. RIFOXYD2_FULL_37_8]OHE15670.1 MAG: flagellar motor protein MotA [Sulfurimonas sp. RIFOXYD12_FULL_36_11]MBS4069557.1 MotA/TolQ/ExbB proton channel family protein [Sulfurimonas sp.]MDD3855469.1 MotA/TolQ/ExbB proton channel family protein [Sulfurimonas sp.]